MKKKFFFLIIVVLLSSMGLRVHAADNSIHLNVSEAKEGETVYVTVALSDALEGDTLGISFEYDKSELTADPEGFEWVKEGELKGFRLSKRQGVWASSEVVDLSGDLCILAFRIPEGFTQSTVSVTLVAKAGAQLLGEFKASTTIELECSHSYGQWTVGGEMGHVRVCDDCGGQQTESHSWGQERVQADPDDPAYSLSIRTCAVCGDTKVQKLPADVQELVPTTGQTDAADQTKPTIPGEQGPQMIPTNPTEPEQPTNPTGPSEPKPQPTNPTGPSEPKPQPTNPTVPSEPKPQPTEQTQPEQEFGDEGFPQGQEQKDQVHTETVKEENSEQSGDTVHAGSAPQHGNKTHGNSSIPEPAGNGTENSDSEKEEGSSGIWLLLAAGLALGAAGWLYIRNKKNR